MLHDFVLVKLKDQEEKSHGGILFPTTSPRPFREGTVLDTGPGVYVHGVFIDIPLTPGSKVTFHASAGITYKDGNHLIKYGDVIDVEYP